MFEQITAESILYAEKRKITQYIESLDAAHVYECVCIHFHTCFNKILYEQKRYYCYFVTFVLNLAELTL